MDIGFSRIAHGRVYSDFSGTSTAEKYLANGNADAPAATDDCVPIGRFAATLSGGAGYTWSVPTFTNANLIQAPITETRWLTYTITQTGYSSAPTTTARYKIRGDTVNWMVHATTTGTSNATTLTLTVPLAITTYTWFTVGRGQDNGGEVSPTFRATAGGSILDVFKGPGITAWTNSGTKFVSGQGMYQIVIK